MPVEWVTAYDGNTGRKLAHRVPRSHLKLFPHLSETPTSTRRRSTKKNTAEPVTEPTSEATTTTPEEEASNGDQSS
jgi:hypothetical protein